MDSRERDAAGSARPLTSTNTSSAQSSTQTAHLENGLSAEPSGAGSSVTRNVTIIGAVDVAQALADNSLENNLYWFDNNQAVGSQNQGTGDLTTAIRRGDSIHWIVSGLEVETSADIASFSGSVLQIARPVKLPVGPGMTFWEGKVSDAAETKSYDYRVTLNLEGRELETRLSLNILQASPPICPEG